MTARGTAGDDTPAYYCGRGDLQPFDVIDAFSLDFYLGNAVKYICRHRGKGGTADLRKARHYLDEAIRRADAADRAVMEAAGRDTGPGTDALMAERIRRKSGNSP